MSCKYKIEVVDAYDGTEITLGLNDEILEQEPYINTIDNKGYVRLFILRQLSQKEVIYP